MPVDATSLVRWYAAEARDLPWRRDGVTGWQILMSEVMLQQTPVVRVAPIWEEWVRRWPVPSAMAASSQADVLRAWGKLGYPRRALRLHECAGVLAAQHDDRVPDDVDVLLTLPGVGAYTARAVACFAYGRRVPVVDTNVRRVVARAVHGRAEPGNPSTTRDLADVEAMLPRTRATGRDVLRRTDGTRRDHLHRPDTRLRTVPLTGMRMGAGRSTRPTTAPRNACRSSPGPTVRSGDV